VNNLAKTFYRVIPFLVISVASLTSIQAEESSSIPRTTDGNPDFSGIWQALGSAHYNIEPHAADFPPLAVLGAVGAIPAGLGVVEGYGLYESARF